MELKDMSGLSMRGKPTAFLHCSITGSEDVAEAESSVKQFYVIRDNFTTLKDVTNAMKNAGVKDCGLIFGIDYTVSNRIQGQKTFGGRSLHDTSGPQMNPYQQGMCHGFKEVLDVYNQITSGVQLSGPTNFVPLIEEAVKIVKETRKYHILVILADGQVTNEKINQDAIVEASKWPLSIVLIGVGDGPWDAMKDFDDGLHDRIFDNFQFVNFHETVTGAENANTAVALSALMEIPEQYQIIKNHELLKNK